MKKQGKRAVDNLFDFFEIIVMAMFVVVLVFTFVFRTVNVQGQSMQDTLFENDSLVISKLLYTPKQGDIVVVNSSVLDNRIIKRIIAVEGQKVEIDNKSAVVKVNGAVLDESYIKCDGSFDDEYFDERYYNKEKEVYDKEVILVVYPNKEHDLNKKYEVYDELLTPLMVFLNNVLDYNGKQRIIEEYGFDTKKIESEVKDICDLGESIALEARNEGKQIERKEKNIAHVKN